MSHRREAPLLLLALLAACTENALIPDEPPTARILSPEPGGTYYSDAPVHFRASFRDAEDSAAALAIAWRSDLDGALPLDIALDDAGDAVAEWTLSEGDHHLSLTVTDTRGAVAEDTISIAVGPPNSAPLCAITAPADGAQSALGEVVVFRGEASDADVPADWLFATWGSDRDGALSDGALDSGGDTIASAEDLSEGNHTITLRVTDEVGGSCTDSALYTVTPAPAPPVVEITAPLDDARFNEGDPVHLEASISDEWDPPEALVLAWSSDRDGALGAGAAGDGGEVGFTAEGLSPGAHALTLSATDSAGLSGADSVHIVINGLPTAPAVDIIPAEPATADDLTAIIDVEAEDPEGGAVSYELLWEGGASGAQGGAVLPASATRAGETWTVTATPSDGEGDGAPGRAEVTIVNTPPEAPVVRVTPEAPTAGVDDLLCEIAAPSYDADGDAIDYAVNWSVDGGAYADAVTSAWPGDTVPAADTRSGGRWRCEATPWDGLEEGPSASDEVTLSCAPGAEEGCPAESCAEILELGLSTGDGAYWIDPEGDGVDAFPVWCDMRVDGGGWTTLVNVIDAAPLDGVGEDLGVSFLIDPDTAEAIAAVSEEIRFSCKQAGALVFIDVTTAEADWMERPYAYGDGCADGYNWLPDDTSSVVGIGPHNYALREAYYVDCDGRVGDRLISYPIGFHHYDWFINDIHYGGHWRLCGGAYDAEYMRMYYR